MRRWLIEEWLWGRLDAVLTVGSLSEFVDGNLLSPDRFLTKICMVSSGSADEAREEAELTLEMLLERMMADWRVVVEGAVAVVVQRLGV